MVKHAFMTLMYRVQQSQSLVSPIFWAATLTGVFYGIFRDYLVYNLRILSPNQVGLLLASLFAITFLGILAMGVAYDSIFKLWREQNVVAIRRNPYSQERLAPKEIVQWRYMDLPTLRVLYKNDPEVLRNVEFMNRWMEKNLEMDPGLREGVRALEAWVNEGHATEVLTPGEGLAKHLERP